MINQTDISNSNFNKENLQSDYDEDIAPDGYNWGKFTVLIHSFNNQNKDWGLLDHLFHNVDQFRY